MIGTLATIFVSAATMFEQLLGWNFWFSVLATAALVGLYTTIGGLKAVVYTDFISCIVLIGGTILICVFGLMEVGGWEGLQEKIANRPNTEHHFSLLRPADDKDYPWPAVLLGLGFVLGPAYWIGNQAIVQRAFGTRSQREARASYVLCAAIKLVFPFLLVIPGMIGLALFYENIGPADAEDWKGGQVLPAVLQLLPTGVLGIILGAFLAGVMSNLDSYVNSASTLWVNDIYKPFINRNASDHNCLVVGRWLVVVFLAAGVGGSHLVNTLFATVYDAFQTLLSFFQGSILALLLLGMLFRRVTQWGGVAGMICGVGTAATMHYYDYLFLWVAWWSFVAAVTATVVVSLMTKPYDDERLRGLVYSLPRTEEMV
jgi:SSS family solute:Na+ symporter